MKKITLSDNRRYVAVGELRYEIARLRKEIPMLYKNFSEKEQAMVHLAYNDILRALYRDELREAESPDEVRSICDMEGDFYVFRSEQLEDGATGYTFVEWADGEAVIREGGSGMAFSYRGMAEHVRDELNKQPNKYGSGWTVVDGSPWAEKDRKDLLNAIFGKGKKPIGYEVSQAVKDYAED